MSESDLIKKAVDESREMLTVLDVLKVDASCFNSFITEDEKLKEVVAQCEYILYMSRTLPDATLLKHMLYMQYFMDIDNVPITNKNKINEILMLYLDQNLVKKKDMLGEDIEIQKGRIDEKLFKEQVTVASVTQVEDSLAETQGLIESNTNDASHYQTKVAACLEKNVKLISSREELLNKINVLRKLGDVGTPKSLLEIHKIIERGNWMLYETGPNYNYINFISTRPIVCKYYNPAAGIDLEVDLGYFQLTLNLLRNTIKSRVIIPSKNLNGNSEHPHVSRGTICFGDRWADINKMLLLHDLDRAVLLFDQLLAEYNPNNPYISLQDLKEKEDIHGSSKYSTEVCRKLPDWLQDKIGVPPLPAIYSFCRVREGTFTDEYNICNVSVCFVSSTVGDRFNILVPHYRYNNAIHYLRIDLGDLIVDKDLKPSDFIKEFGRDTRKKLENEITVGKLLRVKEDSDSFLGNNSYRNKPYMIVRKVYDDSDDSTFYGTINAYNTDDNPTRSSLNIDRRLPTCDLEILTDAGWVDIKKSLPQLPSGLFPSTIIADEVITSDCVGF